MRIYLSILTLLIGLSAYGQVTQKTFTATQSVITDTIRPRTAGKLSVANGRIEWMADPVNDQDGVNKRYLQSYVRKADSLLIFVTPEQLTDSLSDVRSGLLDGAVMIEGTQTINGAKTFAATTTFNKIVSSTVGGTAISATNTSGKGLDITSTNTGGYGATITNSTGAGIYGEGTSGVEGASTTYPIVASSTNTAGSSVVTAYLYTSSPISRSNGYGLKSVWYMPNSLAALKTGAEYLGKWTVSTSGSETAAFEWWLMNSGAAAAKKMDLQSNGNLTITGSLTGTGGTLTRNSATSTLTSTNTNIDGIGVSGYGGYIGVLAQTTEDSNYDVGLSALAYRTPILSANLSLDSLDGWNENITLRLNSNNMHDATAPLAGIGTGIKWRLPILQPWTGGLSTNSDKDAGIISVLWSDITKDAEDGQVEIKLTNNGVVNQTVMTVSSTGDININGTVYEGGTYAEIHLHDASVSQSIPAGTTYTKVTAFTDDGLSNNCTADAANDKITITKTGRYRVDGSFSSYSGTSNITLRTAIFLDGVEQPQIHTVRKFGNATDVSTGSLSGFINVTSVPVDVDVRTRHDQAGSVNLTPVYGNLNVQYLGEN